MRWFILIFIIISTNLFANSEANAFLHQRNNRNYFIENKGQWPQEVKYLVKIGGMNAWITDTGVVYDYYKITHNYSEEEILEMPEHEKDEYRRENILLKGHVVKSIFKNNKFAQEFVGKYQQEAYHNYFLGNDKTKWASNVRLYEGVTVEELYEGIDIKYYFDGGLLRYDFIVKPGADISQINITLEGANNYSITNKGELEVETSLGKITHKDIVAYQNSEVVECTFKIKKNGVGFSINNYDKEKELIIDPLVYSSFLGGSEFDYGSDLEIDNSGNVYVTGYTESSNYPTTSGAYDESYSGNVDVFVTKLNTDGTELIYSTFLGGSEFDYGSDLEIDNSGNVYVTGYTESSNYPTTSDAYDESYNGNVDVFVAKLNTDGTELIYSTFIGGDETELSHGVTIDISGNVYVTGYTKSINFPTIVGAYDDSHNGGYDVFVTKLNTTGTGLEYSTFIGGGEFDYGNDLEIDNSGNVYVTGYTESSNYPTTSGAYDESYNGNEDVFITKLNTVGTQLDYSTFLGRGERDIANGVAIDISGNVYVTGFTKSISFPTTAGAYDDSHNGGYDVFVTKLNSTGTGLEYSTFIGGNSVEQGFALTIDNSENVFVTGYTYSSDYPTTSSAYDESFNGGTYDSFVSMINSTGTQLEYSTFIGGGEDEYGKGISIDISENVYVTGYTKSTNFPTTSGAYDESINGTMDVFLTKLITYTPLIVTSPNGGEFLQSNSQHNITWKATNVENIKIEYTANNGSSWDTVIESTPVASGSYLWTVPDSISKKCSIKITDTSNPAIMDVSNATFTIYQPFELTLPVGGENWQAQTRKNITWTGNNGNNVALIEYSIDHGVNWTQTALSTSSSNSYTWLIPNLSSAECKIRISDPNYPDNYSMSQNFIIVQLSLISPMANAYLGTTSQINITWESSLVNNIKIDYSTNNGESWINIASSVNTSSGNYSWIPNKISSECKLRITDTSDPTITSETNGTFTIYLEEIFARLLLDTVITQTPCYVNAMFHALDRNFIGIENLKLYESNFVALEDSVVVSKAESRLQLGGIDQIDLELKTVILLDNSSSVQPNLQQIKDAAIALINTKLPEQEIALYVFSENPLLIQNFTTDSLTLINAVNSISVGYPSTNLYGSLITVLSKWEDSNLLELIEIGFLVLLTDGDDTQGSSTLSQVLEARGDKKIYAVGLGSDLNMGILQQIGNAGAYNIVDINHLVGRFEEIEQDLIAFTNSFYWINYVSPKRGDFDHTLKIFLIDNQNIGSDSYFDSTFSSNGFYSIFFGITVNPTPQNPLGVNEITIPANANVIVNIETQFSFNSQPYVFKIEKDSLLRIVSLPDKSEFNFLGSSQESESTTVTITDTTNQYTKILKVNFGPVSAVSNNKTFPTEYSLSQNYPNPFNPSTVIKYGLPEESKIKIEIFNMLGQSVGVLVNTDKSVGFYEKTWNAKSLPSGIYLISIRAEGYSSKKNFTQVKKALLLK